VLSYRRSKLAGEQRLLGRRSIGFGGHVNMSDGLPPFNLLVAAEREIAEELALPGDTNLAFQGVLLSDVDATARDHMALVFTLRSASAQIVDASYVEEAWLTPRELQESINEYEPWSQMLIRDLLPKVVTPPVPRQQGGVAQFRPVNAPTELPYAAQRDVAYLGNALIKRALALDSHSPPWAGHVAQFRGDESRDEFDGKLFATVRLVAEAMQATQQTEDEPLAVLKACGWDQVPDNVKNCVLAQFGVIMLSTVLAGIRDASPYVSNFELNVLQLYHYLHCDLGKVDSLQEAMRQFRQSMEIAQSRGLRREDLEEAVRRLAFGN
jgi:8-oxo-dGTP pyrophosphatase MutT (NUDIX family)